MIQYRDWYIWTQGQVVARQFDHMTRSLEVTGELPEGWEWTAIVRVGDYMDYLPLTLTQTGAAITLTAQQLSLAGMYSIQLRGKQGELVRHTNVLSVYVPASLSGDAHWPEIPSEFTQLEQRIFAVGEQAAETAKQAQTTALQISGAMETLAQAKDEAGRAAVAAGQSAAGADESERAAQEHRVGAEAAAALAGSYTSHPPVVGENGNWWTWNGAQYADCGQPSQGELTRAQANILYADALKGTASGAAIRMDDVGSLEHSVPVTVRSKNLFNINAIENKWPHYVVDDTLVLNTQEGGSGNGSLSVGKTLRELCPQLTAGKTYMVTAQTQSQSKFIYLYGARIAWIFGRSIVMTEQMLDGEVAFYGFDPSKGEYGDCAVSKIQIEEGDTATEYTPYVAPSSVSLLAHGKNLSSINEMELVGNANATIYQGYLPSKSAISWHQNYTSKNAAAIFVVYGEDGSELGYASSPAGASGSFSVRYTITPQIVRVKLVNWSASVGTISQVQLEIGATATEYEPYKGVSYTPAEDGTCEVTSIAPTMTLTTDIDGVVMDCQYNRDINKAFEQLTQAIISMGGNI